MSRDAVLELLCRAADEEVSGAELARTLGLSRTAVWKAVEQLRAEGWLIDSVPRRGYRLRGESDVLSEAGIARFLRHPELTL